MSRVFLMKWYHFSVEYFEDLRNVNHCEFLIMRKKEDSGKYILENNLRTWSELKRERLAALKEKENANVGSTAVSEKDKEKEKKMDLVGKDIPTRKRWGGCPNGCDHGKHSFKRENSMHAMQLNGKPSPNVSPAVGNGENSDVRLPFRRTPTARRWQSSSEEDEDDPRGRAGPQHLIEGLNVQKSLDEIVSSPDGTPSFISIEDRLRNRLKSPRDLLLSTGRDFGGSKSGNTSLAGSDTEFSQEEDARKRLAKGVGAGLKARKDRELSGMGRGALADALGDQSDVGSDAGSDFEDITKAEKEDKSIKGSVY
jgi:hypothetical protein